MPNPKRRHSKTRTAKRRTHDALKPVPVGVCPQCHESTTRAAKSARWKKPSSQLSAVSTQLGAVARDLKADS